MIRKWFPLWALLVVFAVHYCDHARAQTPYVAACPVTTNGLTLNPKVNPWGVSRSSITPVDVYWDATNTTDTNTLPGRGDTFSGVTYLWNFGDTDVSGTCTWAHGANANQKSCNTDVGPVMAHHYINTTGADETYFPVVAAKDSSSGEVLATCSLPAVTVKSETGPNGFSPANITCVGNVRPTAGSGGCPAGANTAAATTMAAVISAGYGTNKLLLWHCGDTFTGNGTFPTIAAGPARAHAFGGCQNTPTGLPTISGGGTITVANTATTASNDEAIADLNMLSASEVGTAVTVGQNFPPVNTNLSLTNIINNAYSIGYVVGACAQCSFVNLWQGNKGSSGANQTWFMLMGQRCVGGGTGCIAVASFTDCVSQAGPTYTRVAYIYVAGGHFDGAPAGGGSGIETVRNSGGSCWVIVHNDFLNGNTLGAVLKQHCGENPEVAFMGNECWYTIIEDNFFGGTSGGQLVEMSPENGVLDERSRYCLLDGNFFYGSTHSGVTPLMLDCMNATVRNNIFDGTGDTGGGIGIQACNRGVTGSTGPNVVSNWPANNEIYNNTFIKGSIQANPTNACQGPGPGITTSWIQNNLFFTGGLITGSDASNVVNHNSTSSAPNPTFRGPIAPPLGTTPNAGGYKPTNSAATSGALTTNGSVNAVFDLCGIAWSGARQLGAISGLCP